MKFIKLTSASNGSTIYINPEMIGHLYQDGDGEGKYTRVGTNTHNDGGFKVAEDIEQILRMIFTNKKLEV